MKEDYEAMFGAIFGMIKDGTIQFDENGDMIGGPLIINLDEKKQDDCLDI